MGWFERDEGQRAFERGQSRYRNPHDDSFGADYDERRRARDWEDGHREAEARAERRREEEEQERREQAARERNAANRRAEEEREEAEREYYERAQAEAESDTANEKVEAPK